MRRIWPRTVEPPEPSSLVPACRSRLATATTSATGRLRYGRPSMTFDAQKSQRHGQLRDVCTVKRLYGRSPSRS